MSKVIIFDKFTSKRLGDQSCRRCGIPFYIGEEIVTTGITHSYSSHRNRYHKQCYLTAKGEQIHG